MKSRYLIIYILILVAFFLAIFSNQSLAMWPELTNATQGKQVQAGKSQDFSVKVDNVDVSGVDVWATVTPPDYQSSKTDLQTIDLSNDNGTKTFTGSYTFTQSGDYEVVYYAQDKEGIVASTPPEIFSVSGGLEVKPTNGTYPLTVNFTGEISSCFWEFGDGSNSTEQNTSHTYSSPGTYKAVCQATTSDGTTYTSDPVTINVLSQFPVAKPGSMQTICSSEHIVLDGSSSYDPDGSIDSYAWNQIEGSEVSLNSTSSSKVSFTAPETNTSGSALTFELTVTDSNGQSNSSEVVVAVQDCSPPCDHRSWQSNYAG